MRLGTCRVVLALLLAAVGVPGWGQVGATAPEFQLDYSNPALSPPHWILTLHPDASGHFHSDRGSLATSKVRTSGQLNNQGIEAPDVDRDLNVSAGFADRVFEAARQGRLFRSDCESHMKVAFQGWKKLTYIGPEGAGSCEFNYSKDKEIQGLGESLIAVAAGILEGARLEALLQHDPLGLDSEMEYLSEAAKDGRVQEVRTIREILVRLAADPAVMTRVRKRARALLTGIGK